MDAFDQRSLHIWTCNSCFSVEFNATHQGRLVGVKQIVLMHSLFTLELGRGTTHFG